MNLADLYQTPDQDEAAKRFLDFDPSQQVSPLDVLRGSGRALDSVTGAPMRSAIQSAQKGNGWADAMRSGWSQFGTNPDTAPKGEDILKNAGMDSETKRKILGPVAEMGMDPLFLLDPALRIGALAAMAKYTKGGRTLESIEGAGKALEAAKMSEPEANAAGNEIEKLATSRMKRDLTPFEEKRHEELMNVLGSPKLGEGFQEVKDQLHPAQERILNRFDDPTQKRDILETIAQMTPDDGPYLPTQGRTKDIMPQLPNFQAEPTGTIGTPGLTGELGKDPFWFADKKYGATQQLLEKHQKADIPLTIHTGSDLVADPDYISKMPKETTVNLYMNQNSSGNFPQPWAPSNQRLITAAKKLREDGITVNLFPPSAEKPPKMSDYAWKERLELLMHDYWNGLKKIHGIGETGE